MIMPTYRFQWVFFVLIFIKYSGCSSADDFNLLRKEIGELFDNGTTPLQLPQHLRSYQMPLIFRPTTKPSPNPIVCTLCNYIFDLTINSRRNGASKETLTRMIQFLCGALKLESERVCYGVIDINSDILLYIIDNSVGMSGSTLCGTLLQGFGCSRNIRSWSVKLPPKNLSENIKLNSSSESFKILQLSDIHYDPNYEPNGNADCGEPICCQNDQGKSSSPPASCGYWADYRDADIPQHLLEETINHLKTQEFDFVYFTGDIISHRVWDTSLSKNNETISSVYSMFKKFDVPVYAIFGNHEPHPLNLWTPKKISRESFPLKWLYQLAANFWSELSRENVTESVLERGSYTLSPRPGFRIIAINSNLCYTFNFWMIYDDSDMLDHLQWLADTLKQAEDNNEKVHILSHVPAGTSECLITWDREYSRIVERFSNIITGQFNGHSHWDEFRVFYNGIKPVGAAFNGASLTPYSWSNPSYKIYEVDAETFTLRDYEEWTFDLSFANSQPNESIEWYRLYSFVEEYEVESLEPDQIDLVLYKLAENRSLLQNYQRFKYRDVQNDCDSRCDRENLCQLATTVFGDYSQCSRFLQLYGSSGNIKIPFDLYTIVISIVVLTNFVL